MAIAALFSIPVLAGEDTCRSVSEQIEEKGPWSVTNWMHAQPNRWEHLLSQIETGSECWLNIAREIYVGCDGAVCTAIPSAVAKAMLREPDRVLALVGHDNFNVDSVCLPFLSEDEPDKKVLAYLQKVENALSRARDPKNASSKEECLSQVHRLRNQVVKTK